MSRFKIESEDGEFHAFEADAVSVMPNGVLGVLDREGEAIALFNSDQWLTVTKSELA